VALRIIEWFHEFGLETNGSGEKNSRIYWERLLLKINPKCSLVHFFQGQRAFKNQDLQESLRCYRIANESFYKELLYVPFQRETLDRLGVLCAMLGHLDESKEHFYKYRTLFGNNTGVYHQILKIEYISKDFEAFFKCLLDFPSDLQNLEIGKRKEILTMINSLTFDSKQQILELYLLKSGLSL
jgi:tetratricopeptide (TPR) repeat protein